MVVPQLAKFKTVLNAIMALVFLAACTYVVVVGDWDLLAFVAVPFLALVSVFLWRLVVYNIRPSKTGVAGIIGSKGPIAPGVVSKNLCIDSSLVLSYLSRLAATNPYDRYFLIFQIEEDEERFIQFVKRPNGLAIYWPYVDEQSIHDKAQIQLVSNVLCGLNFRQRLGNRIKADQLKPNEFHISKDGLYANVGFRPNSILAITEHLFGAVYSYGITTNEGDDSVRLVIELGR